MNKPALMKQLLFIIIFLFLTSCSSGDEANQGEQSLDFQIEEVYAISQHRAFVKISTESSDATFQLKLTNSTNDEYWFNVDSENTNELCGLEPLTAYEAKIYANLEGVQVEGNTQFFETDAIGVDFVTELVEVTNPITGRTWMDRNLGAERAAVSSNDSRSYGNLYQWGRRADGHEQPDSEVIESQSESVQPNHSQFIIGAAVWNSQQNSNLWNGLDAINNPCPCGFRLPTPEELYNEVISWNAQNAQGAITSNLKLPLSGYRGNVDGEVLSRSLFGYYWSSQSQNMNGRDIGINQNSAQNSSHAQAGGASIRCIKDE